MWWTKTSAPRLPLLDPFPVWFPAPGTVSSATGPPGPPALRPAPVRPSRGSRWGFAPSWRIMLEKVSPLLPMARSSKCVLYSLILNRDGSIELFYVRYWYWNLTISIQYIFFLLRHATNCCCWGDSVPLYGMSHQLKFDQPILSIVSSQP